jgi:hypothetical protein
MNKEKLDCVISRIRINKAISKTAPRNLLVEMLQNGFFLSTQERCDPERLQQYFQNLDNLHSTRRNYRDKILNDHPEWFRKSPRTKEIIVFLKTP